MKILGNKLSCDLNLRTELNFPIEGVNFIDITPLFIQKDVLEQMINLFMVELEKYNIDYIIAPEARGFLLGVALARELKVGFIPVRKKGKLPPTTVDKSFSYQKEYGADILEIPKLINGDYKNKNFYIIDDIYATGHTVNSIEQAIKDLGGCVVGKGVILNIVELNQDKELFSLIEVNE